MDVTEHVISGLILAFTSYMLVQMWKLFRRRSAIVRLRLVRDLPSRRMRFVLRHIRDGKDEISDKGPLLNEDHRFWRNLFKDEWLATTTYQKNIGFQFKCYVDYPNEMKNEVLAYLGDNGFTEVSDDETLPYRLWFLLPRVPTCETADDYRNNYFHAGLREIVHEA